MLLTTIKDRPQLAKVNGTVFYYFQKVKIKVSNATTKVTKANINMSAVKGGFELSFYGGLKMYDSGGLRIGRCQTV